MQLRNTVPPNDVPEEHEEGLRALIAAVSMQFPPEVSGALLVAVMRIVAETYNIPEDGATSVMNDVLDSHCEREVLEQQLGEIQQQPPSEADLLLGSCGMWQDLTLLVLDILNGVYEPEGGEFSVLAIEAAGMTELPVSTVFDRMIETGLFGYLHARFGVDIDLLLDVEQSSAFEPDDDAGQLHSEVAAAIRRGGANRVSDSQTYTAQLPQ